MREEERRKGEREGGREGKKEMAEGGREGAQACCNSRGGGPDSGPQRSCSNVLATRPEILHLRSMGPEGVHEWASGGPRGSDKNQPLYHCKC